MTTVPTEVVDTVVIGLGPGGEAAANKLARAGRTVIGVEGHLVGGECPFYACVPTKMMIRAANTLAEARRIPLLAGTATVHPEWGKVAARIRDDATHDWHDTAAVRRLTESGARVVRGWGRLTGPGEVTVDTGNGGTRFVAESAIVLGPGADPVVPRIPGLARAGYWTSRDAAAATELPASLLILGGGPVACEFAQIFARFGCAVTMLVRSRLLSREEPEAGAVLAEVFADEGIRVRTGVSAVRADHSEHGVTLLLSDGDAVRAERLLLATGRRPDLAALGVGAIGLDDRAATVPVDDRMRAADRVWAVGDVTGHGAYTHVALYQSRIAVHDILGYDGERADYRAVPRVIFTDPEVGAVGVTEAQARDAGTPILIGCSSVASSARGWIHRAGNEGLIKLIADRFDEQLIGATSVGPAGGEVLSALALAVHARVPLEQLRSLIYPYPTFQGAIAAALRDLEKADM
ncbi:dihydrolipoyl dehydrogenase family protein [Nocardia stercoris]|uniref:NAD(P)/FAD-dependent oxidoreductase n=1 Tax=Nocardia stercoris TaxID=2483361 RepID=A0A3M2L2V0_9NOCA|nr:NAD(P)/FAD-dependent oxidoreductase [Nocardia stercoris]RMI31296.1 NAD(P)/FAD-dependent oxidoreductase [Nocardia stercoris]